QHAHARPEQRERDRGVARRQLADPAACSPLVLDQGPGVVLVRPPVDVPHRCTDTGTGVAELQEPHEQVGVLTGAHPSGTVTEPPPASRTTRAATPACRHTASTSPSPCCTITSSAPGTAATAAPNGPITCSSSCGRSRVHTTAVTGTVDATSVKGSGGYQPSLR